MKTEYKRFGTNDTFFEADVEELVNRGDVVTIQEEVTGEDEEKTVQDVQYFVVGAHTSETEEGRVRFAYCSNLEEHKKREEENKRKEIY